MSGLENNVNNRTIFCRDNIDVLQGINSQSIDLIYLDPPFNKNKVFTAPIGSNAEGASFKDWFREEDIKDEWVQTIKEDNKELYDFLGGIKLMGKSVHYKYNYCYLSYMAIRLIEMQRILKDTGSIYLHCDPTMSHYIKLLMDIIFLEKNFINEIIWNYGTPSGGRSAGKKPVKSYENLLVYTNSYTKHLYNKLYTPYNEKYINDWFRNEDKEGRKYRTRSRKGKIIRQYLDKSPGVPLSNTWKDIKQVYGSSGWFPSTQKERTGYPTQKPLALLERIIKASSNEGDIVLDPFCGCATTCIASEKLNRQWIGIDVSLKAYELVKKRLQTEVANPEDLFQYENKIVFSTSSPKRTDSNGDNNILKKYVYIISNPKYKGVYKVGIANDYKARLNSYQTSDPYRSYKLEYKILTPIFREIEKHVHQKFENMFEWVKADLKDIVKEIESYSNLI